MKVHVSCLPNPPLGSWRGAVMGDGSTVPPGSPVGGCGFLAQRPFLRWADGQYLVSLIYLKSAKQGSQCWWRGCFVCIQVNRKFNYFQLSTNNCVRTGWRKCLQSTGGRGVRDKLSLIQPPGLNLALCNWGYNSHCSSGLKFFWAINANSYIFSLASWRNRTCVMVLSVYTQLSAPSNLWVFGLT